VSSFNVFPTKFISYILISMIATFIYISNESYTLQLVLFIIYFIITASIILCLGMPISLVIDWLAARFKRKIFWSLAFHSTVFLLVLLPFNIEEITSFDKGIIYFLVYFSLIPLLFSGMNIIFLKLLKVPK
jgi:hypothetical protein